jgi:hypothetical protein
MRAETRGKQRKCKQCTFHDHRAPMPGFALAADREARQDLKVPVLDSRLSSFDVCAKTRSVGADTERVPSSPGYQYPGPLIHVAYWHF